MPSTSGLHRRQRDEGGADLAADEHPAGGLHRHLDLQRGRRGRVGGIARRQPIIAAFDLQQVHAGLDEEQVDAAFEEAVRLLLVGVAQLGERRCARGSAAWCRARSSRRRSARRPSAA